jgi:hypothetical protein
MSEPRLTALAQVTTVRHASATLANDHYIPQVLTSPWEYGQRKLRVFDFCTREFSEPPASRLFAKRGVNSTALETWLNQTIDDPIGKVVLRLRRGERPTDLSWRYTRALALLIVLNSQRIGEARGYGNPAHSLEELSQQAGLADRLAQLYLQTRTIAWVQPKPGTELFFTEAVGFAYPQVGRSPALLVPMGLEVALMVCDKEPIPPTIEREPLTWFSLGVGSNVHRVILPPSWHESSFRDEEQCANGLLEWRDSGRQLFNLFGVMSMRLDLDAWQVTD